jgi:hypothetical protein
MYLLLFLTALLFSDHGAVFPETRERLSSVF